ncbi:MAG: ABC-2 family transporter protein, partial [Bacteriovoracaceae bacterium]|nr:ABC-2 family transporter protein [Bacteriovoracaceae bacterium]
TDLSKLPLAVLLCFYYLILVHTISFLISCMAFHFTKISSFTVAKNLALWILMGELFPLDLLPSPYKEWFIAMPFSAGAFLPVGYIVGRVDYQQMLNGFVSVSIGLIVLNLLGYWLWKKGLDTYAGTGA